MPKSINQDIYAGGSVYHIQTEYYKTSGKIVTNIFKDGVSVKRLEREVPDLSGEELDEEIEKFHVLVINKLREGAVKKKKKPQPPPPPPPEEAPQEQTETEPEPSSLKISDSLYRRLLDEISPYFGITSSVALDEALKRAEDPESLLHLLLSEVPLDKREELEERIRPLLLSGEEGVFQLTEELREKILAVLSKHFGIMAGILLDEALEELQLIGGGLVELIDMLAAHADTVEEEEEIRRELSEI